MTRYLPVMIGTAVLTFAVGCSIRTSTVRIPLGEWTGTGRYVADVWSEKDGQIDPAAEVTQHGTYDTDLKVTAASGPEGTVQLDILSKRGKVARLDGDRTHILAKLTPRTPGSPGDLQRYRLTTFGISFDEKAPKAEEGPKGLAHGTYLVSDGDDVLQIQYAEGYVDFLRFRGDLLYKDGVCAGTNGLIRWSEVLRRKPGPTRPAATGGPERKP